jgi:PilZ domain-containing protein
MSDRRTEKRWDVCLDAVWDGKSGNYVARVTDLAEGGCYVDSLGEAQIGEVIKFKLQLPNGEWLQLSGEVAHQSPPLGFGLRFVLLTDEQRATLRSLIDQLEPPQNPASAILSY